MNRENEARLIDILARNFQYQSPTPVIEGGKVVRYNLAMFADDYKRMMGIVTAAGGFFMPQKDRERLAIEFAEKAKTVGGGWDLSKWSMGELAAAHEDVKGIPELGLFDQAIDKEIKARTAKSPSDTAEPTQA